MGTKIIVDDAHKVMAPWDTTECVARGLAVEIALDATAGGHIRYVDAAIAALREEAQMGRFLGRWSLHYASSECHAPCCRRRSPR